MILPVQVTFRNMNPSQEVEEWIREEAAKLDKYYERTTSCRVVVEPLYSHHRSGNPYHIRIDLGVPGEELVIKHQPSLHSSMKQGRESKRVKRLDVQAPNKNLHVTIRDAFKTAKRRLEDYARRRRGEVKSRVAPPRGRISRIFSEEGFGFLQAPDGREVYFHRDSVLNEAFDHLTIGEEVAFTEEEGEKGPQASTVKLPAGKGHSFGARRARGRERLSKARIPAG